MQTINLPNFRNRTTDSRDSRNLFSSKECKSLIVESTLTDSQTLRIRHRPIDSCKMHQGKFKRTHRLRGL
jgi:hypothetical protein